MQTTMMDAGTPADAVADEIASLIGETFAERLFGYCGGLVVVIPKERGKGGLFGACLLKQLGAENFNRLTARFGGQTLLMPKNP